MTIGSRADLQRAMQEAAEAAARAARGQAVTQASLQPIRLQVVRVASEVSPPPALSSSCGGPLEGRQAGRFRRPPALGWVESPARLT